MKLCIYFALAAVAAVVGLSAPTLHVVAPDSNDVLSLLLTINAPTPWVAVRAYGSLTSALAAASPSDFLLALAVSDDATAPFPIAQPDYESIASLNLHAFLEMPSSLPGDSTVYVPSVANSAHRVVTCNASGTLPALTIMQAQGAFFQDYPLSYLSNCILTYAEVAGVDTAVFGLPDPSQLNPVLFPLPSQLLVSAIRVSDGVVSRYTPVQRFAEAWNVILSTLTGSDFNSFPSWNETVAPVRSRAETLALVAAAAAGYDITPAIITCFESSTDWLGFTSGLLLVDDADVCLAPNAPADATLVCMLEGYAGQVYVNGSQAVAGDVRMDCVSETAMALALRAVTDSMNITSRSDVQRGVEDHRMVQHRLPVGAAPTRITLHAATRSDLDVSDLSAGLLNYTWLYSDAAAGAHANVSDPTFGLIAWGISTPDWEVCTYGDDNARVLLSSALAAALLRRVSGYDSAVNATETFVMRSLLANVRIASVGGFRPGRINFPDLEAAGWAAYANSGDVYDNTSYPQPHYQAAMWSAFLWAAAQTGWPRFYDAALGGMQDTLAHFPDEWRWTEYLTEEVARALHTAAWLLRAEQVLSPAAPPNATHIGWMDTLASYLLTRQNASGVGGIQEAFGSAGLCDSCPPASNADYANGEAPMSQTDGDPITDQLYSNNFAVLALCEAAAAYSAVAPTAPLASAVNASCASLTAFLLSIQTQSVAHPELQGGWPRGFHYSHWTYFASASDIGWGPWSMETGWSATWMATSLGLQLLNSSMWDAMSGAASGVNTAVFASQCPLFFPPAVCQL